MTWFRVFFVREAKFFIVFGMFDAETLGEGEV